MNPSHAAPEDLYTVADGISDVLKPNSLHERGCFGSQVIAKYAHCRQFILLLPFGFIIF